MANFMARYRGSDGHYADVECAYAELERYVVLKLQRTSPLSEDLNMKRLIAVGGATLGGVIAFRYLPPELRHRLSAAVGRWMAKHMERIMARLPDDAPPKLVMSILPRLRAQSDQIIALLQDQNELLRERQQGFALMF